MHAIIIISTRTVGEQGHFNKAIVECDVFLLVMQHLSKNPSLQTKIFQVGQMSNLYPMD